jgi:hypothetical protein
LTQPTCTGSGRPGEQRARRFRRFERQAELAGEQIEGALRNHPQGAVVGHRRLRRAVHGAVAAGRDQDAAVLAREPATVEAGLQDLARGDGHEAEGSAGALQFGGDGRADFVLFGGTRALVHDDEQLGLRPHVRGLAQGGVVLGGQDGIHASQLSRVRTAALSD